MPLAAAILKASKKGPNALWRSTTALRDYGVMKWRVASDLVEGDRKAEEKA